MVTFEDMKASVARRAETRVEAEAAERARLQRLLPRVAEHLRALGATEVYLFGSLAEGRLHEGSDVDFATRGLGFHEALRAMSTCGDLLSRDVDVVRLEDAPPTLVARVMDVGVVLP